LTEYYVGELNFHTGLKEQQWLPAEKHKNKLITLVVLRSEKKLLVMSLFD
jgi:hypothetical protein